MIPLKPAKLQTDNITNGTNKAHAWSVESVNLNFH